MKMTLTIDHGRVGHPNSPISCPVALLLWEKTGLQWNVGTFTCTLSEFVNKPPAYRLELPNKVSNFISLFDGRHFAQWRCLLPMEIDLPVEQLILMRGPVEQASPDPRSGPPSQQQTPIETPAREEEPEEVLV